MRMQVSRIERRGSAALARIGTELRLFVRPRVSDTTPDRAKRPDKLPRIRFGVRGVEILDHPKNKPELVGTVVPWERVYASAFIMAPGFALLDEQRKPMLKRVAVDNWGVSFWAYRKIARVGERRSDRTLRCSNFEYVVNTPPTRRDKVLGWTTLCAAVGVSLAMPVYAAVMQGPGFLSGYPLWLQIASVGVVLAYFMACTALMVAVVLPHLLLARRNVKHARVVPWRVEAALLSGERVTIDFRDVDHVYMFGRYCSIRSRNGPCIGMDLRGSDAGAVLSKLRAHVDKVRPVGILPRLTRALSVLVMLALVAGVVLAHQAGLLPGVSLLGVLLMLAGTSALMYGLVWYAHRLRAGDAREPAPWAFGSNSSAS